MAPSADYRVDPDGVAVITLSNPPVNALHPAGKARGIRMSRTAAAGVAGQAAHYGMPAASNRVCSAERSLRQPYSCTCGPQRQGSGCHRWDALHLQWQSNSQHTGGECSACAPHSYTPVDPCNCTTTITSQEAVEHEPKTITSMPFAAQSPA